MRDLVLVHGAFQGAWAWQRVVPGLQQTGFRTFTPTLKGVGERVAEASAQTGLQDHIDDMCAQIDQHGLSGVTLVGHSYAGLVISGVAKKMANKISTMIYVDAVVPEDGESLFDILGLEAAALFTESAMKDGDGWKVSPSLPPLAFGLESEADVKWGYPKLTGQSLKSLQDKVAIASANELAGIRLAYLRCTLSAPVISEQSKRAKKRGWECFEIETHHAPQISHPELFVNFMANFSADKS